MRAKAAARQSNRLQFIIFAVLALSTLALVFVLVRLGTQAGGQTFVSIQQPIEKPGRNPGIRASLLPSSGGKDLTTDGTASDKSSSLRIVTRLEEELRDVRDRAAILQQSLDECRRAAKQPAQGPTIDNVWAGGDGGSANSGQTGVVADKPPVAQPPPDPEDDGDGKASGPPPPDDAGDGDTTAREGGGDVPVDTSSPSPPLLVLGIPTIVRQGGPDYLMRTLGYIADTTRAKDGTADDSGQGDAPGPHQMRVRVVVLNNSRDRGRHTVFEQAVAKYCGPPGKHVPLGGDAGTEGDRSRPRKIDGKRPRACYTFEHGSHSVFFRPDSLFVFATNGHEVVRDGEDEGTPNFPGARVRQQSRDVKDLLTLVHDLYGHEEPTGGQEAWPRLVSEPRARQYPGSAPGLLSSLTANAASLRMSFYSFMEDDFRLCPDGMAALALAHTLAQAELGEWNAVRWSLGLAGGTIRGYDVPAFRDYLAEHLARRPPDHLFVEWFAGERPQSSLTKASRPHVAFRYNLLEHFGYSSSLRSDKSPVYAFCYDDLTDGVVFEVEAFKPGPCGHDLIWPCLGPEDPRYAAQSLPQAGHIDFHERRANARIDTVQTWNLQQQ